MTSDTVIKPENQVRWIKRLILAGGAFCAFFFALATLFSPSQNLNNLALHPYAQKLNLFYQSNKKEAFLADIIPDFWDEICILPPYFSSAESEKDYEKSFKYFLEDKYQLISATPSANEASWYILFKDSSKLTAFFAEPTAHYDWAYYRIQYQSATDKKYKNCFSRTAIVQKQINTYKDNTRITLIFKDK